MQRKYINEGYQRPEKTITDSLQNKKSIQNYLKDYEEVPNNDLPYVSVNSHVRYISWDKENNCELFRLGGIIKQIQKEFLILTGKGQKSFSVQRYTYDKNKKIIHTTRFFKKKKGVSSVDNAEINENLELSKVIIEKQSIEMDKQTEEIEKQTEEINKLKKELSKLKKHIKKSNSNP